MSEIGKPVFNSLRDEHGIYGIELSGEEPHRRTSLTYRPDEMRKISIGPKATLHKLPGNIAPFRGTDEVDCLMGLHMRLLRRRDPDFGDPNHQLEQNGYWGLWVQARKIVNFHIGEMLAVAQPDALKLARRYPVSVRGAIYRFAAISERQRQLCETFPCLATLIYYRATSAGLIQDPEYDRATEAIDMVQRGAPLRDVAQHVGVPMAMRKIPPGAITRAPTIKFFAQHPDLIDNHMPNSLPAIRRWLAAINKAQRLGGPWVEWVARHANEIGTTIAATQNTIANMQDFVCESYKAEAEAKLRNIPPHCPGAVINNSTGLDRHIESRFVQRRFDAGMSLKTVLQLTDEWHEAVIDSRMGSGVAFPAPWCPGGRIGDIEIDPIDSQEKLYREGRALHHCVASYAERIAAGEYYVFSVRRAGKRIATLGIQRMFDKVEIDQIAGPCNALVARDVRTRLRRWFKAQQWELPKGENHELSSLEHSRALTLIRDGVAGDDFLDEEIPF